MENKLEQLLNKLIEKGWCPMGNRPITQLKKNVKVERYNKKPVAVVIKNGRGYADDYYSLRDIISKESGLWQFVCENGLIKRPRGEAQDDVRVWRYAETMGTVWDRCFGKRKPEFYIIESALEDESELEQFLLDNIKV